MKRPRERENSAQLLDGRIQPRPQGREAADPDADGDRSLAPPDGETDPMKRLLVLMLGLRSRAEKQLARPVTHVVIAAEKTDAARSQEAAAAAGLSVLGIVARTEAAALARGGAPEEAAALGAAIRAEDLAPRGE